MWKLEGLRHALGDTPLTITTAFRNTACNASVGGASNSQHLYGNAADVVSGSLTLCRIVQEARNHGFSGLCGPGYPDHDDHIHVDSRIENDDDGITNSWSWSAPSCGVSASGALEIQTAPARAPARPSQCTPPVAVHPARPRRLPAAVRPARLPPCARPPPRRPTGRRREPDGRGGVTGQTLLTDTDRPAPPVGSGVERGDVDVVVIGAGQAGLSAGYFLRRAGFAPETGYVILDGNDGPGGAWRHRWPTLRLDTVHGIHPLPDRPLGPADPARPAAEVVAEYFAAYEREFTLPVHRPVRVEAVSDTGDGRLAVSADAGTWITRTLINATGTWTRPFWPRYPGQESFRGRQLHTADYRGPDEFAGLRVIIVGGGTSAVQLLGEISEVTQVTWVTRRPPVFRDGPFTAEEHGRAAVARVEAAVRAGRPPSSVVSVTGLPRTLRVRELQARGVLRRLPMFDRITPHGVTWDDGRIVPADVILWCTGFRAALDHLAPLRLRAPGGGITMDGTRVVADERVHLVGYGPSASTIGANRAGRAAVREIRRLLRPEPVRSI